MTGQEPVRLQKILADAGVASRRASERLILEGRVRVNGKPVTLLGAKAVPGKDRIEVDGRALAGPEPIAHYMFNKPEGFLTALSDGRLGRPTIATFLEPLPHRVYPVGRLDRDVTGFLLLTNDGELARRLMHPSFKAPKVYRALVQGHPGPEALRALQDGSLLVDGKPVKPAKARMLSSGPDKGWLELTLTEGRHRQVKRMCSQVGHKVQRLKRVAYSGVRLDPALGPGSMRELSPHELRILREAVGLPEGNG
ncbi:MAG: rRNA pseudouridine synthase [Deltaproteobacteria bacterium]|jgi:pseudouridine synthase|nr:rRNA pseudouridine synthase [Deltaproteobacteria bacterium]